MRAHSRGYFAVHDPSRGRRLANAIRRNRARASEVARTLGVAESALSRWKTGELIPVAHALRTARVLNCSLDWLLLGRAEVPCSIENDPQIERAISFFCSLSREDRHLIQRLTDSMSNSRVFAESMEFITELKTVTRA